MLLRYFSNKRRSPQAVSALFATLCVAIFLIFSIPLKYLHTKGVSFQIESSKISEFQSSWTIFLSIFILFTCSSIYITVSSYRYRLILVKSKELILIFITDATVASLAIVSIFNRNAFSISGVDIVGVGIFQKSLNLHTSHTFNIGMYDVFYIIYTSFSVLAAVCATVCVTNFAIISCLFQNNSTVDDRARRIISALYKRNFIASCYIWSLGIIQLVFWLRLPLSSISLSDRPSYLSLINSISTYNAIAYTIVLIVSSIMSIRIYANRLTNKEGMLLVNFNGIIDNKIFIYFAAPIVSGFIANIFSNIIGR